MDSAAGPLNTSPTYLIAVVTGSGREGRRHINGTHPLLQCQFLCVNKSQASELSPSSSLSSERGKKQILEVTTAEETTATQGASGGERNGRSQWCGERLDGHLNVQTPALGVVRLQEGQRFNCRPTAAFNIVLLEEKMANMRVLSGHSTPVDTPPPPFG